MRDPITWSLPLGRYFGAVVRLHVLFPVVALGMILRVAFMKDALPGLWIEAAVLMGLLFVAVVLHEFGHLFGARAVDGDCQEILIWPLGGLAYCEVPHTPRANFICTAAGPLVNLLLSLVCVAVLATQSLLPSFKPWSDPYLPTVYNWTDGCYYGSKSGHGDLLKFTAYKEKDSAPGTGWQPPDQVNFDNPADLRIKSTNKPVEAVPLHPDQVVYDPSDSAKQYPYSYIYDKEKKDSRVRVFSDEMSRARSGWIVLLARFFWVNWFLFWLNLIWAFPLDGGRLLQSVVWWWRGDYRHATLVAIFFGFIWMFIILLYALTAFEQVMPLLLAYVIYVSCRRQWLLLETGGEESLFGYDFSQGYTSLEREQSGTTPTPPRRRQSWWQRWMQRRAARKLQRELEQREAEERRMDELLEKIQRQGRDSLTDEERRFLTRVSARYRHRQQ
jgi:Zn-dependent protease